VTTDRRARVTVSAVAVAVLTVALAGPVAAHTPSSSPAKKKPAPTTPAPPPIPGSITATGKDAPVATLNVAVPYSAFSVQIAPEVTGPPYGLNAAGFNRVWDDACAWRDIETAPGVYDWTNLDARVSQNEASGLQTLYVLGLTPPWIASTGDGDPRYGAGTAAVPADMNAYSTFVSAVAGRYGNRIAAYEVWNEANLKTFWVGTPEQMADMTARAYTAVKGANPNAKVFAASTTTRLPNSIKKFTVPYYVALKNAGWPVDGFAIHAYPSGVSSPVERYQGVLGWRQALMSVAGNDPAVLNKEVWDTEVNYGLAGPGATPKTDFSGAQGAGYIARTYLDSVRLGITSTFWYLYGAAPFSLLGIQMTPNTPETLNGYNTIMSWIGGATYLGTTTINGVHESRFSRDGKVFTLLSADTEGVPYTSNGPVITVGINPIKVG
jgi:hypothetical protein